MNQYFFEAFEGLERLSPGSTGSSLMASKSISRSEEMSILEIGCGKGITSLLLAQAMPLARIIAIDNHQEYIRHLSKKAAEAGVSQQVQGMVMSMEDLQFPEGQFDVICCEGAVYNQGFEKALEQWKKFLKPNGQIIVNDLCWLKAHVPKEVSDYWKEQYPDINTVQQRKKQAKVLGYEVKSAYTQPPSDWIEHYYKPLHGNLVKMIEKYRDNPEAMETIKEIDKEMIMYSKYAFCYGYVMFTLEKAEKVEK